VLPRIKIGKTTAPTTANHYGTYSKNKKSPFSSGKRTLQKPHITTNCIFGMPLILGLRPV
jgi:hypothetical protein